MIERQAGTEQAWEPALRALSAALRRIHKALLEVEAEKFGPVAGPGELLELVINHEHFAWLRHLSELMVDVDERLAEDEPVEKEEAASFKRAVESLVGPRTPPLPQFRERYTMLLQESPAAVMAHGDLRRALDVLPDGAE